MVMKKWKAQKFLFLRSTTYQLQPTLGLKIWSRSHTKGKPKKPCPLLKCPNEIIRNISDYLKLADILTLMRTSRNLHTILDIPFHDRAPPVHTPHEATAGKGC